MATSTKRKDRSVATMTLKIGDLVTFRTAKSDAFMSAEGILLEDVYVTPTVTSLNDALFAIHLPRQYSAQRELDDYRQQVKDLEASGQPVSKNDKTVANFMNALCRGADNEQRLNNRYMQNKQGQPVRFGDVVQLFHVKSGKYLTVRPSELATTERENIRVSLDGKGSIYSGFYIMPRFKIDREGDFIPDNTDLFLSVAERKNEYAHCADRESASEGYPEINCSLEPTPWKMSIFQSSNDAQDESFILGAEIIYIVDPETNSALTPLPASEDEDKGGAREGEEGEEEDEEEDEGEGGEDGSRSRSRSPSTGRKSVGEDGSGGEDDDEEEEEGGEKGAERAKSDLRLVLKQLDISGHIDTRSLWMLEFRSKTQGGPIYWRTEQVRLRNLCSGSYLRVLSSSHYDENDELVIEYDVSMTPDSADSGTIYSLAELTGMTKTVLAGKAFYIKSEAGGYFARGSEDKDIRAAYTLTCKREKLDATNLQLIKYAKPHHDPEDTKQQEPLDVYVAMASRDYLQKFLDLTVLPKVSHVSTLWPTADRSDIDVFLKVIRRSITFSQGFPISAENVVLGVDKSDLNVAKSRQRNMREQRILDVLIGMCELLVPISARIDEISNLPRSQQPSLTMEEQAINKMSNVLLENCLNLLYYCILDNGDNQMHVADNIRVLIAHLGSQPLAGKCVTEMLSKNKDLQENKIGDEEIEIFVDKLRSSKMNSMYLQLLQACCSCEGEGVDGNQCRVTDQLFANTNDIIINVHADYTKIAPIEWRADGLYLPPEPVPGSPVLGESLYRSGLPALSMSWTTNSIDYSPLGLFGKLSVNVQELYRPGGMSGSSHSLRIKENEASAQALMLAAKKNQSVQQKDSVKQYFVAQMRLMAEMVMDRNYVAMQAVDSIFSYEVLVTILKSNVQDDLKAAAARLVRCLHVDRDPQASTKIPILTRTWSSVCKQVEPKLPFVGESQRFIFGLLQEICADFIDSMAGKSWGQLSKPMLELYSTLINFNFYGTIDRIQDVINPLMRAVDRRTILYPGDDNYGAHKVEGKSSHKDKQGTTTASGGGGKSLSATSTGLSINEEGKEEDPDLTKEEGEDGEDGGDDKEGSDVAWQQRLFDIVESIPYLLCILALVLAAVAMTLWSIEGNQPDTIDSPVGIWGIVVLLIFIGDVTIRGYCGWWVKREILPFFLNFFNQIDLLVITIDIVFLCLPNNTGGDGNFTKTARLVRMVRLLRLFRVAKIVQAVVEAMEQVDVESFKMPLRYTKAPIFELDAMVEIINVLLYANKIIADRNLSIFLRKFHDWEQGLDTRSPPEIFDDVVSEGQNLTLGVKDMDFIFLDCIMFVHKPLVQGALDVIMHHHSNRSTLLQIANNVQLLVSNKRERQFLQIQNMHLQLERNAETHELWGELQSDADFAINKQTKDILVELAELCRSRRFALDMHEGNLKPEKEIQDLFSNLGCFPICQKVLGLLGDVEEEEDGTLSDVALNTRELCLMCNNLVYWFCLDNPHNQEQVYEDLAFFFESLDAEINSHLVIKAIFKNNEKLMKLVPHIHLSEMIELIVKNGKSHHYLALLVSITNVGPLNLSENQFEIIRVLSQGGRLAKTGIFLVPRTDKKYTAKVKQMEEIRGVKDASPEDMPKQLAYYVTLMDIFASCCTGRTAPASLEAKLQSIYSFTDAIDCVLDMRSIMSVKVINLKFLFRCIFDVTLPVPGLAESSSIWKLINTVSDKIGKGVDYCKRVESLGWEHPDVSRHEGEFIALGSMVVCAFFEKYYNRNLFLHESASVAEDKVHMNQSQADHIITNLFTRIRAIIEHDSPRLSDEIKEWMRRALRILNTSRSSPVDVDLDSFLASLEKAEAKDAITELLEQTGEKRVLSKYQEFLQCLNESPEVKKKAEEEAVEFITVLESLPFVADMVESDLRYELLIKKVVAHVRENMSIIDNETRIDNRTTKTSIWLIGSFRSMIENKMGMSIYERDEDGGEEQDLASEQVKTALNTCGATALCLDLIVDGVDSDLQLECIRLIVGLLFLEGGNKPVQGVIHDYLNRPQGFLFFRQVESILEELSLWHSWQGDVELAEGVEPSLPDKILILRMLQLMSEGHYLPNQDLVREQPDSDESVNLLDSMVSYLKTLSHHPCRTSTHAALALGALIVEVLQGPCRGNQEHLALNTDILETCNRLLRAKRVKDCVPDEEVELKKTVVDLLSGIIEGQNMRGPIYERVLSVLHVDVIQFLVFDEGDPEEAQCEEYTVLRTECLVLLESLVESKPSIRQEFKLPDDMQAAAGGSGGGEMRVGCVEIWWNDEMHRRFFHIPDVCTLLSKASKDQLVLEVKRETQEIKLTDFLERARGLYRETKHQEYLVRIGLNAIFSRSNQEAVTWFSFTVACIINVLFMAYYHWDVDPSTLSGPLAASPDSMSGGPNLYINDVSKWKPQISIDNPGTLYSTDRHPDFITNDQSGSNPWVKYSPDALTAVAALKWILLASSFYTLTSVCIVRLPVVYQAFVKEGNSALRSVAHTACDLKLLYYIWYITFVILGIASNDQYITFLLLDLIYKNPTAQTVLNAVVVPIKPLMCSLMMTEIINYIFAFYFVSFPLL